MLIVKKNGNFEEFDIEKTLRSIENAAGDINLLFNVSDINLLKKDISNKIIKLKRHNKIISTYEIKGIVIEVLMELGFKKVIESYLKLDR